ncbi:DUF2141 domain-containing protein [Aerophototrophica crusticola]|uniref:DUF2141 domain-containing protein n=1 Tax=Aerophototrophica crusticola TaxID=1709002 RepID=A0A858R512_9PROT|nr:DUF2141 domain-containing protein [Rhodospirillaceae bacterium B3]
MRKTSLALSILMLAGVAKAFAATPAPACDGGDGEVRLNLTVEGVRRAAGNVTITLYPDDPDKFLARTGKIARIRVPATVPATSICLPAPEAGGYAIAVYHDENGDKDFNRTMLGMPKEGYGFSNNAETTLGLPRFQEVRFDAKAGDNSVTIRLRY